MSRARRAAVTALAAAAGLGAAGPASASSQQESILMDDAQIVYAKPDALEARLAEIKALGVDRIRVSVYWHLLVPSPGEKRKPAGPYGSADPRFYGESRWDRYDRIVALAAKHHLGVLFTLTGPAPLWATGKPDDGRSDVEDTWEPSPSEFKDFATAVGTRYSGTYRDPRPQPPPPPLPIFPPPPAEQGPVIGRVDHWSIWNEPNHGGWLTPQWQAPSSKRLVPASPRVYRPLVDSAWSALQATGHGGDSILVGETSPRGLLPGLTRGMYPLRFIRELYCIRDNGKPYMGAAAQARDCPTSFDAPAFVAAHPGLFAASGWAHHPYSLTTPPRARDEKPDDATLSGIPRLTRTLDRIFARYGQSARLPIWVTEYGFQTNPPDPTSGLPWWQQADWLDDATFVAYANPRIASMAQFLLVDDGPNKQYKPDEPRYWGTFQTGLVTLEGTHKPSYEAWMRPIAVSPRPVRRGHALRVFGQLRSAPGGQRMPAEIQFRARGSKTWKHVTSVTVESPRNFLDTKVKARRSGSWRINWGGGGMTRAVAVAVR